MFDRLRLNLIRKRKNKEIGVMVVPKVHWIGPGLAIWMQCQGCSGVGGPCALVHLPCVENKYSHLPILWAKIFLLITKGSIYFIPSTLCCHSLSFLFSHSKTFVQITCSMYSYINLASQLYSLFLLSRLKTFKYMSCTIIPISTLSIKIHYISN